MLKDALIQKGLRLTVSVDIDFSCHTLVERCPDSKGIATSRIVRGPTTYGSVRYSTMLKDALIQKGLRLSVPLLSPRLLSFG